MIPGVDTLSSFGRRLIDNAASLTADNKEKALILKK
jgi:hypothetical protein